MSKIITGKNLFYALIICYVISVFTFYGRDFFLLNFLPVSVRLFYPPGDERDMLRAVVKADVKKIEELIENKNVDVNQLERSDSFSYLLFAFINDQKESFTRLLDYGASPDLSRNIRHTFTLSTYDPDTFYIEKLLEYPENFIDYVEAISGQYIFPTAIDRDESLRRYNLLYESGANPNRPRPNWPVKPIEKALIQCDYDRVLILLSYNVIFGEFAIKRLIDPPSSHVYKKRESSATRKDVQVYLKEHYGLDIVLKEVINNYTGEIIE